MLQPINFRPVWLLVFTVFMGACSPHYIIFKQTAYVEPLPRKLKLLIWNLEDLTGNYENLHPKLEDLLELPLKGEKVRVIANVWRLDRVRPFWINLDNFFDLIPRARAADILKERWKERFGGESDRLPILNEEELKKAGRLVGADFLIYGTVEEIYYGPPRTDALPYYIFGLLGGLAAQDGGKVARLSFRLHVLSLKEGKIVLTRTVDAIDSTGSEEGRKTSMANAVSSAVPIFLSYLFERR